MIKVMASCSLLARSLRVVIGQKWLPRECANSNDNTSPAEVGRYMQQTSMTAFTTERIFLVLAGQATITRGQEISCEFNVRSRLLQSPVLQQKEETYMLGSGFPLDRLHPPPVGVKQQLPNPMCSYHPSQKACHFLALFALGHHFLCSCSCRSPGEIQGFMFPPSPMTLNIVYSVTISPPSAPFPERTDIFCQASINSQPNCPFAFTLP